MNNLNGIEINDEGKWIDDNWLQCENACASIIFTESGISSDSNEKHKAKAASEIAVIVEGKIISDNARQPIKQNVGIYWIFDVISIDCKLWFSWKHPTPNDVIVVGIIIDFNATSRNDDSPSDRITSGNGTFKSILSSSL